MAWSKLPSEPVAVTVYPPVVPEEIFTLQLNTPEGSTVPEHAPTEAPPLIAVEIVTEGVNPLPDMLTVIPLGPWLGLSEISGVVIVKAMNASS